MTLFLDNGCYPEKSDGDSVKVNLHELFSIKQEGIRI
jgi:hypothetical protein